VPNDGKGAGGKCGDVPPVLRSAYYAPVLECIPCFVYTHVAKEKYKQGSVLGEGRTEEM
jgi:hypothetical protein